MTILGCGGRDQLMENGMATGKEKREIIAEARRDGCRLCGSHERLHFHHIRPKDKLFDIHKDGIKQSLTRLQAELDKCVVLCNGCHLKVHKGLTAPQLLDLTEPSSGSGYVERDPLVLAITEIWYGKKQ